MIPRDPGLRKRAAALGRSLLEGKLTYEQFIDGMEENEDEEVSELEFLVEHIPARGGFFGASEKKYARHMAEIEEVIRKLEST